MMENKDCLVFKDIDVFIGRSQILHKISGKVQKSKLLAILGASGAGKSTLLSTLAGRRSHSNGEILFNSKRLDKDLVRRISFARQEDVFLENLTLYDTLKYSALLRLPETMTKQEKLARINSVVDALQLNKCLHTVIGNKHYTGLSGGERKRANIATELLGNPDIILIDEPTTGLDSYIARKLMGSLESYTRQFKKIMITSIHQPSWTLLEMYDDVLVLSNGKVVYFGCPGQIVNWLQNNGMECPKMYNPADFILQRLRESNKHEGDITGLASDLRYVNPHYASIKRFMNVITKHKALDSSTYQIRYVCRRSNTLEGTLNCSKNLSTISENQDLPDTPDVENYKKPSSYRKWPTGFTTQFRLLVERTCKDSKHRILCKDFILQTIVIAFSIGLVFFRLPRDEGVAFERINVAFAICICWTFTGHFIGASSFPYGHQVFKRERAAGTYRLSAYFLAKIASESPMMCLLVCSSHCVAYWMSSFTSSASAYLLSLAFILLYSFVSQSLGVLLGIFFEDLAASVIAANSLAAMSSVLSGYFHQSRPAWIDWTKYITPLYHAYEGVAKVEYIFGPSYKCSNISGESLCIDRELNATTASITGRELLDELGMTLPLWTHALVLIAMWLGFLSLGYIILRCRRQ